MVRKKTHGPKRPAVDNSGVPGYEPVDSPPRNPPNQPPRNAVPSNTPNAHVSNPPATQAHSIRQTPLVVPAVPLPRNAPTQKPTVTTPVALPSPPTPGGHGEGSPALLQAPGASGGSQGTMAGNNGVTGGNIAPGTQSSPATQVSKPPEMFSLSVDGSKVFGGAGKPMEVITNYYHASFSNFPRIQKYMATFKADYEIKPKEAGQNGQPIVPNLSKNKRRRILTALLTQPLLQHTATDYFEHLVSTQMLGKTQFTVDLPAEGQDRRPANQEARNWTVTLNHVGTLDCNELRAYHSNGTYGNCADILSALNLFVSRIPSQHAANSRHGASGDRFFPLQTTTSDNSDLAGGLKAAFGFRRSMRVLQWGLMLQVSNSAAAFYQELRVDRLLDAWLTAITEDRSSITMKLARYRKAADRFIKSLKVRKTYGGKERHTIWGLAWDDRRQVLKTLDDVSFEVTKDGRTKRITLRNYLNEKYGEKSFNTQIVVNVGNQDHPVYVPANKLVVLPGNIYTRLLNPDQTGKMVTFAARRPNENLQAIKTTGAHMFEVSTGGFLNMIQNPQLATVPARLLGMPSLRYLVRRNNGQVMATRMIDHSLTAQKLELSTISPATSGFRTLREKYLPSIGGHVRCAWVYLHSGDRPVTNFGPWISAIRKGLQTYCSTEKVQSTLSHLGGTEARAQRNFPQKDTIMHLQNLLGEAKQKDFDVLFVLLRKNTAANYERLKQVADCDVGIHTICTVVGDQKIRKSTKLTDFKSGGDYVANLMLKVNLKMGGVNTSLNVTDPKINKLLSPETMIVGADVTHPGPGSMDNADSIAAVVATYEDTFSQYPTSIRCQNSRQEMIEDIGEMFGERLNLWTAKRGTGSKLPEQIIFFRDGVSEDQFYIVANEELPKIEKELVKQYSARGQPLPKILVVCVVKRVNTRFYASEATTSSDLGRNGNLHPGLVVDKTVTRARGYDFFLQSQIPIQGTAKPTHYVVLSDKIGVDPDTLQQAIYHQCWTFQTSLMPVSVHPAARMADKACGRARAYLREYYVSGPQGAGTVMDRNVSARQAWRQGAHAALQDTTFYV